MALNAVVAGCEVGSLVKALAEDALASTVPQQDRSLVEALLGGEGPEEPKEAGEASDTKFADLLANVTKAAAAQKAKAASKPQPHRAPALQQKGPESKVMPDADTAASGRAAGARRLGLVLDLDQTLVL